MCKEHHSYKTVAFSSALPVEDLLFFRFSWVSQYFVMSTALSLLHLRAYCPCLPQLYQVAPSLKLDMSLVLRRPGPRAFCGNLGRGENFQEISRYNAVERSESPDGVDEVALLLDESPISGVLPITVLSAIAQSQRFPIHSPSRSLAYAQPRS